MEVKRVEIQRPDRVQVYEVGGYLRFEGQDKNSDIMTTKIEVKDGDVEVSFSKEHPKIPKITKHTRILLRIRPGLDLYIELSFYYLLDAIFSRHFTHYSHFTIYNKKWRKDYTIR